MNLIGNDSYQAIFPETQSLAESLLQTVAYYTGAI